MFEINEGGKTTIKDIDFVGNRAYSTWRLRDVIKTGQSNLLSFLKNNDLYDPDRVEADRDLLRRWYLKNGYADVRIVSAVAEFDPRAQRLHPHLHDRGRRALLVRRDRHPVERARRRYRRAAHAGCASRPAAPTTPKLVEKSVEEMTIEMSQRGYAFAQVRPRGDRNFETRQVSIVFVVEEGARAYIERINLRGNTRTRDYVIRREFDIAEGDAYNRVLVDRAERRLKNLGYFKTVKITTEPGSAADRIILNVDVEEQSTGEFSVAGGYSTADGLVARSLGRRTQPARARYRSRAPRSVTASARAASNCRSPSRISSTTGSPSASTSSPSRSTASSSFVYRQETIGGGFRFGIPLREDLGLQLRYSAYRQKIDLDQILRNCNNINPNFGLDPFDPATYPTSSARRPASIRRRLRPPATPASPAAMPMAKRPRRSSSRSMPAPAIVSLVGYGLVYNTVDNNRNPTRGLLAELRQDFAGIGGDVNFIRTTGDARYYYEIMSDIVSVLRVQAGHITGWGGKDLRMLDHFQMGPNLVRGFQTAGIGPRDLTLGTTQDALGGTMYWGASFEVQIPIFGLPKDFGMRFAMFADAGSVWGYRGPTTFRQRAERDDGRSVHRRGHQHDDRALLGRRGRHLGFAVRPDPRRLRVPAHARIRTTGCRSCGSPAARNSSSSVNRATAKVA